MQNKVLSLSRSDFMLILGALLAVLLCNSEAKHVTTNYRVVSREDPRSNPSYPEDNNHVEENQDHGQKTKSSQSPFFYSLADVIRVIDDHQEFQDIQDDEEESKMISDLFWKACEGKKYLECHQQELAFEILNLNLFQLAEAYAQYSYGTTWKIASVGSSRGLYEFPLASDVYSTLAAAKNCESVSPFEMNQANMPSWSSLQDTLISDSKDKSACVMSSIYEIVTMLTWFVDVLHLDVAMGTTDPQSMKYTVLEHVGRISDSFIRMYDQTLDKLSSYNNIPNDDVVVKVMKSKYTSAYGDEAGARGLRIINLLIHVMDSLANL